MDSVFLKMLGARQSKGQFTAKQGLRIMAVIFLLASGVYWHEIIKLVTTDTFAQLSLTLLLTIAPPTLSSFIFPFTPTGMLLRKYQSRTIGNIVVIASAMVLIYYQWVLSSNWWATQAVVTDSNLVILQSIVGLIGFVAVPALAWPATSDTEMMEQISQNRLVQRYELQTKADIAILRNSLIRARDLSAIGFANLSDGERQEMNGIMRGITKGIDHTLDEMIESVNTVSGAKLKAGSLQPKVGQYLDYVAESLELEPQRTQQTAPSGKQGRANNGQNVMTNAQQSYGGRHQPSLDEPDEETSYSSGTSYSNRNKR